MVLKEKNLLIILTFSGELSNCEEQYKAVLRTQNNIIRIRLQDCAGIRFRILFFNL